MSTEARRAHWDGVYATKAPEDVSWRQEVPARSLALIAEEGLEHDAAIIDIGAGASTLIDALLTAGLTDLTALDISEHALAHTKSRLGWSDVAVEWIVADITKWRPTREYALWHDRAVLHFLTDASDQQTYATALRAALAPGGIAIISGFAPGGPEKCSGLPIVQHDASTLRALLGDDFVLVEDEDETHTTPWGATQAFRYHIFMRA